VIFAKQHLLRLGIILYGFRLTFAAHADVGNLGERQAEAVEDDPQAQQMLFGEDHPAVFPAIAGAGFSALTLAILFGMVVGNTVYPKIWQPCLAKITPPSQGCQIFG
jgi:uncharacterized membrane protein YadS